MTEAFLQLSSSIESMVKTSSCEITKFGSPACRFHVWQNLWKAKPHKHRWKAAGERQKNGRTSQRFGDPNTFARIVQVDVSYIANWGKIEATALFSFDLSMDRSPWKRILKRICWMWNGDSPFRTQSSDAYRILHFHWESGSVFTCTVDQLGCGVPRFRMEITAVQLLSCSFPRRFHRITSRIASRIASFTSSSAAVTTSCTCTAASFKPFSASIPSFTWGILFLCIFALLAECMRICHVKT